MNGWTGRCLRVNLSENDFQTEEIPQELMERFLGGRGLGAKVLSNEMDPQVDPLSPDSKIIFVSGPLVGTGAVTGASCNVVTKSALSGTIACAKMRGHFGAELKFAGFDMIIVEGKADSPVILSILDDKINIQPAPEYWGRTTSQTEDLFLRSLSDQWAARETYLLSIGPAGEKLVPLANIVNDGFLSVGGAGIGAVMGSKNLKAIAVKGSHSVTVAYGFNRADWSYIPGGAVSGTGIIRPDFPELKEWPYFWQQTEYVMGGGASNFMFLVLAAQDLMRE